MRMQRLVALEMHEFDMHPGRDILKRMILPVDRPNELLVMRSICNDPDVVRVSVRVQSYLLL